MSNESQPLPESTSFDIEEVQINHKRRTLYLYTIL